MKIITLFLGLFLFLGAYSQDTTSTKSEIKIQIHGFVKTDYWYDSRQVAYAREGLFTLFPKDMEMDKNGRDINGEGSFNYSAITSRLNFKIDGFNAFGAKTFGFIEADFSGMSNATLNSFRLRHAYLQMNWKKTELLMGQYWHPMFVTEVFPTVISLNTGAPFQPFIRSPQIRLTHHIGNFKMIVAALAQRDYSNIGPLGRDFSYLSNSLIPNLHLQFQYQRKAFTLGAAADWKALRPRLITDSNIITKSTVSGLSYMAYFKIKKKNFEWKTKAIYGQNLTEHLLLGGYAVAAIDSLTDVRTYTPTNHIFLWTDFLFTKKYKRFTLFPRLFLGYAKNLGTSVDNTGIYYATGSNIDIMYRVAPSISIKSGNTMFSLEWEVTQVNYGDIKVSGLISNTHSVTNHRFLLTGFYFF